MSPLNPSALQQEIHHLMLDILFQPPELFRTKAACLVVSTRRIDKEVSLRKQHNRVNRANWLSMSYCQCLGVR